MLAAVVTSFDQPPSVAEVAPPAPQADREVVVDVLAAGLHPRVRSQANGSHYSSTDELPLVPGVDGVGRASDGTLRYFVLPDTTRGSMAEQTLVDLRRSIVLPDGIDPVEVAAAMNPAMSSWVALRRRVVFDAGQSVLVLGATGNAGSLAVQVARHLGASRVVAAGRRADRLAACADLGADATVSLVGSDDEVDHAMADAARDVDVVLDYVWSDATALAMRAIVGNRSDDAGPLHWVEIGSVGGPTAPIPSAALRAVPLQIVGSGQGSVSTRAIVEELPALAQEIGAGTFRIDARAVPLTDLTAAWSDPGDGRRIVFVP